MNSKQLLFGIAQGGIFKNHREKSAKFIDSLDFDGIAMGGLCIGETRDAMFNAINYQIPLLNPEKPRYLMGVGSPEDLLEAISCGCDVFDSRFPTKNARHGTLFTTNGKIAIDKGKFSKDKQPIDEECDCYVCKNFTRAYVSYSIKNKTEQGKRMVSIHNLHFLQNLMKNVHKSIKDDCFKDFKEKFLQKYLKKQEFKKKKFKTVYS